MRQWEEASGDWSIELKLWKQERAKPVQASQSKGCGLYPTSNRWPLQVSKQEGKKTRFALCKDHSSHSVDAAFQGGGMELRRQSRGHCSQQSKRGWWPGPGGGSKEKMNTCTHECSRIWDPQPILYTAARFESRIRSYLSSTSNSSVFSMLMGCHPGSLTQLVPRAPPHSPYSSP